MHSVILMYVHVYTYIYAYVRRYSCDEGMSWRDFDFTTRPVVVWGVVTEPGQTTTQVLLVIHCTQYYISVLSYYIYV